MSSFNRTDEPLGSVRTIGASGSAGVRVRSEPGGGSAEIVRSLCHDMRQPLATLRMLAECAVGPPYDPVIQSMIEEVTWLSLLVDSVLGEPTEPGLSEFWLGDVALAAVRLEHAHRRCDLRLMVSHPVRLRGRPISLQRAVLCLLDNACRAAGAGGHVEVGVSSEGAHGMLTVADDGPGLGKVAHQHSLGLATVRAIVADVGGHFSLANGAGKGVVATIRIPALEVVATP